MLLSGLKQGEVERCMTSLRPVLIQPFVLHDTDYVNDANQTNHKVANAAFLFSRVHLQPN